MQLLVGNTAGADYADEQIKCDGERFPQQGQPQGPHLIGAPSPLAQAQPPLAPTGLPTAVGNLTLFSLFCSLASSCLSLHMISCSTDTINRALLVRQSSFG